MLFWCVVLFVMNVHGWSFEEGLTTTGLKYIKDLEGMAEFGDAQHRGHKWYADTSSKDYTDHSYFGTDMDTSSSSISTSSISSSASSEASSVETKERRRATQYHRACNPCPHDMAKGYNNIGIKWICGGYQRARRSFKSECMMRYRNCQDGTLFVKLTDHRCKNDSYHGRHFFYIYRV